MHALLTLSRTIDRLNEQVGRHRAWLVLAAVLISATNAAVRKIFNTRSKSYLEAQWYLFAAIFLLASGYTMLRQEHVKIDVVLADPLGSTVFSLAFQGVDGPKWVEHLLTGLPGWQTGFLIVVNALVFLLAFFVDFFELSFIVIPQLAPVADKLGIDLVWFGVLLAVNMQTAFMHPPFGFALFYLRSVAPHDDYKDRVSGRQVARITTGQIYWGAVPDVVIQIVMVGMVIAFPGIVSRDTAKSADSGAGLLEKEVEQQRQQRSAPPPVLPGDGAASGAPSASADSPSKPDPMTDLLRAAEEDKRRTQGAPATKP